MRVRKVTESLSPLSFPKRLSGSNSTCPAASVAWPHSATSLVGVNQRSSQSAPPLVSRTTKAVSAKLFSSAIACSVASDNHEASGITAAWLPAKGRLAKASTCQ